MPKQRAHSAALSGSLFPPLTLWQSEFMARIFNSSRPFLMQFVSVARDERVSDINFTKQKREKGTEIDRKRERGSVR